MIVEPDFFDHWKTRMLVDALGGDEAAPLYVLRLWAHCQNRRKTEFKPMPNRGVKALCRYPGDPDQLVEALEESGFITRSGGGECVEVVGWREHNAQLVTRWENGSKGGRPKKEPDGNRTETEDKPEGNRTEPKPDKRREDKRREDNKKTSSSRRYFYEPTDMATAEWMLAKLREANPEHKKPGSFKPWANTIRLMRERDGRTDEQVRDLFAWSQEDVFWGQNILSPQKLREKWDQLVRKRETKPQNGRRDGGLVFLAEEDDE